jgi:hypothetical protein
MLDMDAQNNYPKIKSGTLKLKSGLLNWGRGAATANELAKRSMRSQPGVQRMVAAPHSINQLDLGVLSSILIHGQGLTPEEVLNLQIKDLFDFVPQEI